MKLRRDFGISLPIDDNIYSRPLNPNLLGYPVSLATGYSFEGRYFNQGDDEESTPVGQVAAGFGLHMAWNVQCEDDEDELITGPRLANDVDLDDE